MQTIAGKTIVTEGGNATQSLLRYPVSVAVDSAGNTYISDQDDNRVWKVDSSGKLTTLAGNGRAFYGGDNGAAPNAALDSPSSLAVDPPGNIYICDRGNNLVRMVSSSGIIITLAGNRSITSSGDGGPATRAGINPIAIAVDKSGNLFISEGSRIREVSAATGIITTVAGGDTAGNSGDTGQASAATLGVVTGLAVDNSGNLYLADFYNAVIRKIDPKGVITRIGGTGTPGYSGDGAPATTAKMLPYGLAIDPAGTGLYLTEPLASTIRRIDFATGRISIVAGSAGMYGFSGDGQTAFSAILWGPYGIAVTSSKDLIIADTLNQRIRRIAGTTSQVSTIAGTNPANFLNHPEAITIDSRGTRLDIADTGNSLVKQLNLSNGQMSNLPPYYLLNPDGVAEDSASNVYASSQDAYVYKFGTTAQFSYFAGTGVSGFSGENGKALNAMIGRVTSVQTDSSGNVYIADYTNSRIRKIDAGGSIVTVAGSGSPTASGDGRAATAAGFDPYDIAIDKAGNFYVADRKNNRIRKFTVGGSMTTIAGTGTAGFSGDNGPATNATLSSPTGVAVDANGVIYIADFGNNVLRKITTDGVIHTIAGDGVYYPFNGDGPALQQNVSPVRVAVDNAGTIYLTDWANDRIRKLTPVNAATLSVVSGDNQTGSIGAALPQAITVKVLGTDGNPFAGAQVVFAVTSGAATVAPTTVSTANDGTASASVTFGATAGTVTISATVAGLATVGFTATSTAAPITPSALTIVSGDKQTGNTGSALAQPLVVKVTGGDGKPFAGAAVTFAVASGSATLNPGTPQQTGADGTASVEATLGSTPGPVSITARVTGLPPVTFSLTANTPPQNVPQIFAGGVVSAGLSIPAMQLASPNAILSIFGQNFAPAGTSRKVSGGDLVNGLVPTNLLGVCVSFGDKRAPVFLVTPGQLNVQAPQLPPSGTVAVQVITNCDTPLAAVSNTVNVPVVTAAPEFFYSSASPEGKNPIAATDGTTGGGVGDPSRLGQAFALAYPGEIIQIYATGCGLTDPAFAPGQLPPGGAQVSGITVNIDGVDLPASAVQYAGVAPLNAGLYQLNVVVPLGTTPGDHSIKVSINGVNSPAGSYLSVGAQQ